MTESVVGSHPQRALKSPGDSLDRVVSFHALSFVTEAGEVLVGRPDEGQFVALPEDGAELLRRLVGGASVGAAAAWYGQTYGEPVAMDEFIEDLAELGFIRDDHEEVGPPPEIRFRRLAAVLLSPVSAIAVVGLVTATALALTRNSTLRPDPAQVVFSTSLLLVMLVITFGQIPLIFIHEACHVLAGKRLGLSSRLDVSNRLTYVVFETQLNGLLSVERRHRYLPLLVGMVADAAVYSFLVLAADLSSPGATLSVAAQICLALAFTVVLRVAWQFQLYLRTDLYYVASTLLRCYDLHDASKALMWNRWWNLLGKPERLVDETQWTDRDRRAGVWYGPFLFIGIATSLAIAVLASVPVVIKYATTGLHDLASGPAHYHFWDALVTLGINVTQATLLVYVARRKRRRESNRRPRLQLT